MTDMVTDHTASYLSTKTAREEIRRRIDDSMESLPQQWAQDDSSPFPAPLVYLVANGSLIGDNPNETTYSLSSVASANQSVPPSGTISWEFTGSCATGAVPPDVNWDCITEMPNIQYFIQGGGNGVTVGMYDCVRDVFGEPFFDIDVYFVRDDGLPAGTFAQYTTSVNIAGTWTGFINMPTGCGRAPAALPWGAGGLTARDARLEALTHEMVHAFYDRLNFYYHPWTEGMTEIQSILARRLWCQRNAYAPTSRQTLDWGVPVTLPLYENCNQEAMAAAGGFFYDGTGLNPRNLYLGATRYQMASAAWWKVYRETSPSIIDAANPATYGVGTYFVDFNSLYYDYYALNGDGGWPGIRENKALLNGFTAEVLDNEKGNSNVEELDYESGWFGGQQILRTDTMLGGKLYVPHGPSTPIGGQMYTLADNLTGICDFGTHFSGNVGGIFMQLDNGPIFYRTMTGGTESPTAGNLAITAYSLHATGGLTAGQDVTNRVSYHDAHDATGWPTATAWTPLPGGNVLTFGATGRLASIEGGAAFPPALYFRDPALGVLPTGGYQIVFDADDGAGVVGQVQGYFANQEQTGNNINSGIILGGGASAGDRIAFNVNGGAFTPLAGFGGDCSFQNPLHIDGAILGYEYRGAGAPYSDYAYANTGRYYYVSKFVTSYNRLNDNLPPYIGRYGFAMISQSTDYGASGAPNRVYYCQYVHPNAQPDVTGITNLVYRPDYIPSNSRMVKCYIYANSVGRNLGGGVYEHEPILINSGRAGNPTSEFCTGTFLGRNNDTYYRPNCGCRGWSASQSTFRFDATPYITDVYDYITVTNLWQDFEPGSGQRYGFEIVMIFENDSLPLSQVMIADGALTLCNNDRDNSNTVFTGFRTPPNPNEWVLDDANAGAYVGIIGNSADNGSQGNGTFATEWDYWAVGTNLMPMDRFWLNPQPADPNNNEGGAWYAPGWRGPTGIADVPTKPTGFPTPYYYSPRAMNQAYVTAAKQYSCAWFWNRSFTTVAAKTALMWRSDPWWNYVNQDFDTGTTHIPSNAGGIYSYLAGEDSSVTLRPYLVCTNADPPVYSNGRGPCVRTEFGNNGMPGSPNNYPCAGVAVGPGVYYPRSEERGHMHGFILQVPIVPSLDIHIECAPDPVLPDAMLTLTVTVTNNTPYTQTGVVLNMTYPNGTTFYDASPMPDNGDNIWTTSLGINGNGSLNPLESVTVVIRLVVGHLSKGTRLQSTCITYADTAPNPEYDTCTVSVLGEPELTITKTSKKFMAIQGDKIKYTLTVQNIGDREAMNVILTDLIPREFEYVSSMPSGSVGLQKIVWAIGQLNPGEVYRVTLYLRLRDDIRINPGVAVINRALAYSAEGLSVEDSAVLVVQRGNDQPVTCPKPDIDVTYKNGQLCINVDKFGGCSPYTAEISMDGSGDPLIVTIDGAELEKCVDLDVGEGGVLKINLKNRYDGSYFYCYEVTSSGITKSVTCP